MRDLFNETQLTAIEREKSMPKDDRHYLIVGLVSQVRGLESANTDLRAGNIRLAVELKDWRDRAYERLSEVAELDRENKSLSAALSQCREAFEYARDAFQGVGLPENELWEWRGTEPFNDWIADQIATPPPPASAEKP